MTKIFDETISLLNIPDISKWKTNIEIEN